MLTTIPPKDEFDRIARHVVAELHTEWDTPLAQFMTLGWDGSHLGIRDVFAFAGDIEPAQYPMLMLGGALRVAAAKDPAEAPIGALFQTEAWLLRVSDSATPAERADAQSAARAGKVHEHPSRVEVCQVHVTDVYGRYWCATKTRSSTGPDPVDVEFVRPDVELTGRQPDGLRKAVAVFAAAHGVMPGSQN